MLDAQFIRDHPELVKQAIQQKQMGDGTLIDRILDFDVLWRKRQAALEKTKHTLNTGSKAIGKLMKAGQREEAQALIAQTTELKGQVKAIEEEVRTLHADRARLLLDVPNLPHPSVPVGATPDDNQTVFTWGEPQTFAFEARPHWEILEQHGWADFERGAKVTGAGFPFYVGVGARLHRALIQFFLDLAGAEGGYTEMQPPFMVNAASATATGQLPDKEDQMYEMTRDGFYMVPTAEVPVTNFLRDEILPEADLPLLYCAYTPCFRREAGSYGKEVRGLNRLHQFDKVELVQYVHPDQSYEALEQLREDAERAVQRLGLTYRRLLMCTGDMGFTQAKKYDLEVWSPGQQRWLEVSSVSNFEAFQARRANIRFRPEGGGRPQFVHTLNGSGLALPRIVAALLETYQQEDGTVRVPNALQSYMGGARMG